MQPQAGQGRVQHRAGGVFSPAKGWLLTVQMFAARLATVASERAC